MIQQLLPGTLQLGWGRTIQRPENWREVGEILPLS